MGALTVRELRKEDLSAVRDPGRRAFPLFHAFLMSATMSKEGLVAEDAPGTIVGSLTLSIRRGKVYGFLVLIQPPSGQATVLSERSGAPLSFSRIGP